MSVIRTGRSLEEAERGCSFGVCDGSGWILDDDGNARSCECRRRRIRRGRMHGVASVIPARYRGVSFDRPPVTEVDPMILREIRKYTENLEANLDQGRSLWLMGDTGTGKTTLAMLVSKYAIEAGYSVAIYSLPKLLARIRRTYEADPGEDSYLEFFERLASVDLLHLDDLGAERQSEWVIEQLYAILNQRYDDQRSVIEQQLNAQQGSIIESWRYCDVECSLADAERIMLGLLLVGMLGALSSTLDTHMNWGASYWSNDLYKRAVCEAWLRRTPGERERSGATVFVPSTTASGHADWPVAAPRSWRTSPVAPSSAWCASIARSGGPSPPTAPRFRRAAPCVSPRSRAPG